MIPLSRLGISREEKDMLAQRLYPDANRIFLKKLAQGQGYDPATMELLDYSDHPEWKMKKLFRDRDARAERLKKRIENGEIDISKYDVKYKTFDEAVANEPGKHVEMKKGQSIEELEIEIEKVKYHQSRRRELDAIEEEKDEKSAE